MRSLVIAALLALAASAVLAQPVGPPAPDAAHAVSGVTVQGKTAGQPKPCSSKDSACVQAVVAALHNLTGVEKQKFEIWCMATATAQMRRSMFYSGEKTDSAGGPIGTERGATDPDGAVEMACSNIPKDKKARG